MNIRILRLNAFASRRYTNARLAGSSTFEVWQLLGNSVYQKNGGGAHSLMLGRPSLGQGQGVSFETASKVSCLIF